MPREGRFSITWSQVNQSADVEAIAGAGKSLYAVAKSDILTGKANGEEGLHWTPAGVGKGFISMAKGEEGFYAVDRAGVFYYLPDLHGEMKAKTSRNGPMLTAIACMQERLYAVNNGGELLSSAAVARPDWESVRSHDETVRIVSLTTADNTSSGLLQRREQLPAKRLAYSWCLRRKGIILLVRRAWYVSVGNI